MQLMSTKILFNAGYLLIQTRNILKRNISHFFAIVARVLQVNAVIGEDDELLKEFYK